MWRSKPSDIRKTSIAELTENKKSTTAIIIIKIIIIILFSVAIETAGTWNHWAGEFVLEIGRRDLTGQYKSLANPENAPFLFQQLSIAYDSG